MTGFWGGQSASVSAGAGAGAGVWFLVFGHYFYSDFADFPPSNTGEVFYGEYTRLL